ncbi:MAG: hypothetical protein Q3992_05115 [Bacteroides sp.]|nr:hypothetical protein [Bacteroides sp.]
MKVNFISLAIASAFAAFTLTSCGEDSPNNPAPDPFGGVARAKFHNQTFEGTGVVFEIEPKGKLDVIKYRFEIEGKDIFHDKNLNGKKDADEKLDNKFKGILEMPAKNNKGLFVILGDVYKIDFLFQDEILPRSSNQRPNWVKSSNFDGSRSLTLTELYWWYAGMKEIVLNGKRNIKNLRIGRNEISDSSILKGLDNIENLEIENNKLSGDIDLRYLKNIKGAIWVGYNKEANFILPEKSDANSVGLEDTKTKAFNPKNYPNLEFLDVYELAKNGMNIEEVINNLPDRTGKEQGELNITKEEYNKHKATLDKKNWWVDY